MDNYEKELNLIIGNDAVEINNNTNQVSTDITTFNINNRTINIPPAVTDIVVKGDTNSRIITFELNRYFDGVDLSTKTIRINYENSEGLTGNNEVANIVATESSLTFDWTIESGLTTNSGNVKIAIDCYEVNSNDNVIYRWQTIPLSFDVLDTIEVVNNAIALSYEKEKNFVTNNNNLTILTDIHDTDIPIEVVNRTINTPLYENIVVSMDNNSQIISFTIDRYFDGVDLLNKVIAIKYINALNESDRTFAVNVSNTDNKITFGWLIDNKVTKKNGYVRFAIEFLGYLDNGEFYCWSTKPSQIEVSEGLYVDDSMEQPTPSWLQSWQIQADNNLKSMELQLRINDSYVQWKHYNDSDWENLFSLNDIQSGSGSVPVYTVNVDGTTDVILSEYFADGVGQYHFITDKSLFDEQITAYYTPAKKDSFILTNGLIVQLLDKKDIVGEDGSTMHILELNMFGSYMSEDSFNGHIVISYTDDGETIIKYKSAIIDDNYDNDSSQSTANVYTIQQIDDRVEKVIVGNSGKLYLTGFLTKPKTYIIDFSPNAGVTENLGYFDSKLSVPSSGLLCTKGTTFIVTVVNDSEVAGQVFVNGNVYRFDYNKTENTVSIRQYVNDANYVHTDNNFTTAEKQKLGTLANYDDTTIKEQIAGKQDELTAGKNITIDKNSVISANVITDYNNLTNQPFKNLALSMTKDTMLTDIADGCYIISEEGYIKTTSGRIITLGVGSELMINTYNGVKTGTFQTGKGISSFNDNMSANDKLISWLNTSHKDSQITESANDDTIPTSKAVKDYVDNLVTNKIDQSQVGNGLKFENGQLQLDIPVASDSTTYGGDTQ